MTEYRFYFSLLLNYSKDLRICFCQIRWNVSPPKMGRGHNLINSSAVSKPTGELVNAGGEAVLNDGSEPVGHRGKFEQFGNFYWESQKFKLEHCLFFFVFFFFFFCCSFFLLLLCWRRGRWSFARGCRDQTNIIRWFDPWFYYRTQTTQRYIQYCAVKCLCSNCPWIWLCLITPRPRWPQSWAPEQIRWPLDLW